MNGRSLKCRAGSESFDKGVLLSQFLLKVTGDPNDPSGSRGCDEGCPGPDTMLKKDTNFKLRQRQ